MSYEGYVRVLCSQGHVRVWDAYEDRPEQCSCGSPFVWFRGVDQTNCDGEDPPLEVATPAVTKVCDMGHEHVVVEATYRIPRAATCGE